MFHDVSDAFFFRDNFPLNTGNPRSARRRELYMGVATASYTYTLNSS